MELRSHSLFYRLCLLGIALLLMLSLTNCNCGPKNNPDGGTQDSGTPDTDRPDPGSGAACTYHQQCNASEYCGSQQCRSRCQSNSNCPTGNHCDPNSNECRPGTVGQAPNLNVVRRNIDNVTFFARADEQDTDNNDNHVWHEFTLPNKTISWTIAAEMTQSNNCELYLLRIEGPNNTQVYPFPTGLVPSISNDYSGVDFAAAQIPHTPLANVAPGAYRVQFAFRQRNPNPVANKPCDQESYQGRVISLIKTADHYPTKGTLDVNIYIVGLEGITSQNAATNQDFQRMFNIFKQSFTKLGITIGNIKYVNLTQEQQTRFAVIQNDEETQALFALSQGQTNQAINLFFVRNFADGGSLGLAGNIPGPSTIHGTRASGVVIVAENLDQARTAQSAAETTAHELGHYLGLYHLSELEGTSHDTLPDTPQCTNEQDANGDSRIDASECVGFGADYVMFYEPGETKQERYSPNQRFVVLMNPAIR